MSWNFCGVELDLHMRFEADTFSYLSLFKLNFLNFNSEQIEKKI